MVGFTELVIVSRAGTDDYHLKEDFHIITSHGNFLVRRGFITNFASIPTFFHRIISPADKVIREGAVIHDLLYSQFNEYFYLDKAECDDVLIEVMEYLGASYFQKKAVRYALKFFGGSNFRIKPPEYETIIYSE